MADRLAGKVVCISGIGRGQGRAAALLFAREGATIVVCDMNAEEAEATAKEVRASGGALDLVMADARIESDVARWIGAAVESHGHINVLYNNAAYTHFALHEMKLEDWQAAVQGELDVVFLGCKHALSHMMRQASGVIVSTASISGLVSTELPGLVGGMAHAAGKAGVMGLTRNLAQEYARHGIRANAIAPGLVETPSNPGLHVPAYRDEAIRRTPLGRIGKPEDVAYAARYLCSDEASFVTGQVLVVDGGWSIY